MKHTPHFFLLLFFIFSSFPAYSDSNDSATKNTELSTTTEIITEQKNPLQQDSVGQGKLPDQQISATTGNEKGEIDVPNKDQTAKPQGTDNTDKEDKIDALSVEQSTDTKTKNVASDKDNSAEKLDLPKLAPTDQALILEALDQLTLLNQKMSLTRDERIIDQILGEKNNTLEKLVDLLGKAKIDELSVPKKTKHQNFLNSRIVANEERGNVLAVQRDKIKLAYYKVSRETFSYLQYLMNASRNYTAVDEIVDESVTRLNVARKEIKQSKVPEFDSTSKVFSALKKNNTELDLTQKTYRDILSFVISSPGKIATTHWFQKFSLLSSIAFFNNFDVLRPLNHKLAPLRIDAGGVIVSLLIMILVVFCYPFAVKGISWVIEKYFIHTGEGHSEEIYRALKRPIFALIVFFSLDMATYALLYKTEYKSSLEDFVFVVYTIIYLWIIFKVLDSVVVVQLDKFSQKNRELRKELVNLGIQISKGLFIIIAVSLLLNRFGISITALMSTLGIGGLAFALAAKDSLSNLLGGVTLLVDNVFSLGDWVKIGEVEGTAVQIGLRSTTIRTFDNALITIPNSVISVSSVRNWNRRAIGRRIKMRVGVTYESNMDDIRQAIEDIRTMLKDHTEIANPKEQFGDKRKQFRFTSREDTQGIKSTQLVYMDRFNDFSIDILIYCFSRSVDWTQWLEVKEDVLFKIAEILKQNNLEFAYPTAVRIYKSEGNNDFTELDMINTNIDSVA
jgi:MscS family membrane protein